MSKQHNLDELVYKGPYENHTLGKIKGGLTSALEGKQDDDIIAYLDGYDAMWLCDSETIKNIYHKHDTGVLLSGERFLYCAGCPEDIKARFESTFPSTSPYRYINAGAFVGNVKTLRKFHQFMESQQWAPWGGSQCDQAGWYQFALEHPDLVTIDENQELSSTVSVPGECPILCDRDGTRAINGDTKYPTCAIHTAGKGNSELLRRKAEYDRSCT